MNLSEHQKKVAQFLLAIATGEMSVNSLQRIVEDAKQDQSPSPKKVATLAAAEEALSRHEASMQKISRGRRN